MAKDNGVVMVRIVQPKFVQAGQIASVRVWMAVRKSLRIVTRW